MYEPNLKRCFQLYGIEVICSIGIHQFEREKQQRILIDLDVHLDPKNELRLEPILRCIIYYFC